MCVRSKGFTAYLIFKALRGWTKEKGKLYMFHSYQAVFFAMVEPMARATRSNNALQLISLDPNQFVHPLVAPQLQAFSAQLHSPR